MTVKTGIGGAWERHAKLMASLKLLPIFRCGYCCLPHPTRYCPEVDYGW